MRFFQKANQEVTVINKTEQVIVKENLSLSNTTEKVSSSVVSIITMPKESSNSVDSYIIKSSKDIKRSIKTGLVITSDGLIISVWDENITENDEKKLKTDFQYKVLLSDGKEYNAQLQAVDNYLNVVYYKIDVENLSVPPLGQSQEVEIGEKAIICGNASGNYKNTFSYGIFHEYDQTFSLLNSELSFSDKMEGAFVTSAQINHSNRGGPVINYSGEVIGIANQIVKDGELVSFVLPMDKVKKSIDQLIETNQIQYVTFGAYYLSINKEIALLNNLPFDHGALVYSFSGQQGLAVIKNSSADLAGIRIGDIILKIDEQEITLENSLSKIISTKKPGDEIELAVYRDGEEIKIKIKLK